jgi:hypothetical protein
VSRRCQALPVTVFDGDTGLPLTGSIGDSFSFGPTLVKCCIGRYTPIRFHTIDGIGATMGEVTGIFRCAIGQGKAHGRTGTRVGGGVLR